jgi:hypothetical protein
VKQAEGHVEAMSAMIAKWKKEGLFEPRPVVSSTYGAVVVAAIVIAVMLAPQVWWRDMKKSGCEETQSR